ncbi:hypothetical protein I4U23_014079 [Adineta vaga]|nr:hypothetical protein I4U23_014079 [Adineta vaga]
MSKIVFHILSISFLLFSFFFTSGSSQLQCWRCDPCPDPHDNSSSITSVVTCSAAQIVCVKNIIRVLGRETRIVKGCTETCTSTSSNFFGQGAFVDCCNTDYCNSSGRNQLSLFASFLLIFCLKLTII